MDDKETLFNVGEDICEIKVIHKKPMKRAKEELLDEDTYMELSETFKLFGNPTRLKIMSLLIVEDLCVCDISEALNMSQSAVSHQLRILKSSKLVKYRKDANLIYYSLADDHVKEIFELGCEHINEI